MTQIEACKANTKQQPKNVRNETKKDKELYSPKKYKRILYLEILAKTDRKKFVKSFKRITGATDWDLPDVIFSEK